MRMVQREIGASPLPHRFRVRTTTGTRMAACLRPHETQRASLAPALPVQPVQKSPTRSSWHLAKCHANLLTRRRPTIISIIKHLLPRILLRSDQLILAMTVKGNNHNHRLSMVIHSRQPRSQLRRIINILPRHLSRILTTSALIHTLIPLGVIAQGVVDIHG